MSRTGEATRQCHLVSVLEKEFPSIYENGQEFFFDMSTIILSDFFKKKSIVHWYCTTPKNKHLW